MANQCLICESCKQVVTDFTKDELHAAKVWGFYLCGMGGRAHKGEKYPREYMRVVTESGERKEYFKWTKEVILNG